MAVDSERQSEIARHN